jgi:hypothetical protein
LDENLNPKSPPYPGGQAGRKKLLVSWGPLVIAPSLKAHCSLLCDALHYALARGRHSADAAEHNSLQSHPMGMANAKIQAYTRIRSPWRVSERRSAVAVLRTGILPALLVLVMSICLSTSVDARRWKWWHYYSSYERSARSGDYDRRRARASEVPGPAARAGRGGDALGAVAERQQTWLELAAEADRPVTQQQQVQPKDDDKKE